MTRKHSLIQLAVVLLAGPSLLMAGDLPGSDSQVSQPGPVEYLVKSEASSGVSDVLISDVRLRMNSDGSFELALSMDAQPSIGILELDNPARVIVDFSSTKIVKSVRKTIESDSVLLQRVRLGNHDGMSRVVFDVNYLPAGYLLKRTGTGVTVSFPANNRVIAMFPDFEKIMGSTPVAIDIEKTKTELRPVVPIVSEKHEETVMIDDVKYEQFRDYSQVIIKVKEKVKASVIFNKDNLAMGLRIDGVKLPQNLERTLDVSETEGPVQSVSTFTDNQNENSVLVVAKLSTGSSAVLKDFRGGVIIWEFHGSSNDSVNKKYTQPVEKVTYTEEKTAGATSSLPTIISNNVSSKVFKGKRISLDFKDADIHNILRLISDVSKLNIITSDDVRGKVTVTLRNVPWDEALDIILQTKGLGVKQVGNILRIAPQEVFIREAEAEAAKKRSMKALDPLYVRLIPVNYGVAAEIIPQIKDVLSDRGSVNTDTRTNVIIVKDIQENIIKAEGLIRNLDTQTPQVLIEARIVEANTTFTRDIGIQWGGALAFSPATGNSTGLTFPNVVSLSGGADDTKTTSQTSGVLSPSGYAVNMPAAVGAGNGGAIGLILGSANGTAQINLRLTAMESTGDVKILSSPRVTTLDNKEAKIGAGTSIPYSVVSAAGVNTTFVEAKLELTVTPHVTQDGSILMKINTTKNEPDFSRTGAQGEPTILKKEASTEVMVKDGDTTVIGGIYTRKNSEEYSKVPFLADIPVLGWLFKKKKIQDDRQELLIFITPRIINRNQTTTVSGT